MRQPRPLSIGRILFDERPVAAGPGQGQKPAGRGQRRSSAALVDPLLASGGDETIPPSVYPPQREPYNPGELEWGTTPQPSDFEVWTYVNNGKTVWFWMKDGKVDHRSRAP